MEYGGGLVKIQVVSKGNHAIASIMTLRHKQTLVYKYGCSDPKFHNLGGVALLFWKAIQEAKQDCLEELDFGRSDFDNEGLVRFKDQWGTTRSIVTYRRYPARPPETIVERYGGKFARRVMSSVPDAILELAGKLLYRHVG